MIKVEISGKTEVRNVTSNKGGQLRQLQFLECEAFFHLPGMKYPMPGRVTMPRDVNVPYAPGMYDLSPQSLYVDKYGSLNINPVLVAPAAAK